MMQAQAMPQHWEMNMAMGDAKVSQPVLKSCSLYDTEDDQYLHCE